MFSKIVERPRTRLLRLPKRECANYGTGFEACNPCKIEQGFSCRYFERGVLPLRKDLEGEYFKIKEGRG